VRLGAAERVRNSVAPMLAEDLGHSFAARVAVFRAAAVSDVATLMAHARRLLADPSSRDLELALCLDELGRVLDPDPVPWTAVVARSAYAWAGPSTLHDVSSGNGVLDRR
jgi:hypothetical protein